MGTWDLKNKRKLIVSIAFVKESKKKELQRITFEVLFKVRT